MLDTVVLMANAFFPAPQAVEGIDALSYHQSHRSQHHFNYTHSKPHYAPLCPSIEGYSPNSILRTFDFSPCFESAVILTAPLVFLLLLGAIDYGRGFSRKGPWKERHGWSKIRLIAKMTLLSIAAVFAVIHLVLKALTVTHPFKNIHMLPPLLHALAIPMLAFLSYENHHYSIRSSSVILLFWPVYVFSIALYLRTKIAMISLGQNDTAGWEHWNAKGKATLAMFIISVGFAMIAWFIECWSPEESGIKLGDGVDYSATKNKTMNGNRFEAIDEVEEEEEEAVGNSDMEHKVLMEDNESPMLRANIYSRLTFAWLTPMMKLGAKRYITEDDMWPLPSADSAEALNYRLTTAWKKQLEYVKQGKKKAASLKIALFQAFGGPFLVAGIMKAIYDCLSFLQPLLLRYLLQFVQSHSVTDENGVEKPEDPIKGYVIAIAMFITANLATALLHQYFDRCFATTMRIKGGLVTLIYRKSLVLSNGERAGRTTGDIVNLQSVDAVRIADLCQYGHIAWSGPLQIILAFISLYNLLGWQSFVGVGVMIVSLPINTALARKLKALQKQQMKNKDARTRLMNEILSNIKSIKLYGWEKAFSEKVLEVRNNRELRMIRRIGLLNAYSFFIWSSTPFLVAFSTFATFAITSDIPLTSERIFPAISLFTLLSFPLAVFSNIINSIIEAIVSVGRLEDFLKAKEIQQDAREVIIPESTNGYTSPKRGEEVVTITNGEFRWDEQSIEPTLQDINLDIKKGELLAVLGRVGDGKSSLLASILGEMTRSEGSVIVRGEIAYFAQSSFVLSASIKNNIVFNHKFDSVFYEEVLDACALRPDLAILPEGDQTQVGEKGVSLSGGQKARIALARCVYARADIYLLDDPLSAVDAHVGKHIFDRVIGPNGLLRTKTRVLCTNAVTYLPETDDIVMLRRGIILERDTYRNVMNNPETELYKLITGLGKQGVEAKSADDSASPSPTVFEHDDVTDSSDAKREEMEEDASRVSKVERRMSMMTVRKASMLSTREAKIMAIRDLKEDSRPKEHSEQGSVKRDVYKNYIKAASRSGVAAFLLCILLSQATSILDNLVLRYWGSLNSDTHATTGTTKYLFLYGIVGLSSSAFSVAATILLWVYCAIRCSRQLHDTAFAALMRAPLSYFEQTPQGRILNVFSRDIFVVDEVLVRVFSGFFRTMASVLGVMIVIAFGAPIVLIAVIPMGIIYRMIMRYYLATSRELKRLDAVSRSPVFAWFGETLAGATTIRAFSQQSRFIASNEARVDRNQACYMPAMSVNRWLAVRLEALGSCLMFAAGLTSVTAILLSKEIDAGLVGIVMSYTISVTGSLNWAVRSASEVEQNIVSVERVLGYTHLTPEAPAEIPENKPAPTWPSKGVVEFRHYSARYRPELELCLRDVSFKIQGGERIGICGRTGAGKSSTTLALFRIIEAASGSIHIDDVDISTIGLHDLRSAISIIPQDPQLFEGSLRGNLDPLGIASDAELWLALEQSYLKEFVQRSLGGSLDAEISEGGSNLSSGQRQLVCFARALLRKTKILILDEVSRCSYLTSNSKSIGIY